MGPGAYRSIAFSSPLSPLGRGRWSAPVKISCQSRAPVVGPPRIACLRANLEAPDTKLRSDSDTSRNASGSESGQRAMGYANAPVWRLPAMVLLYVVSVVHVVSFGPLEGLFDVGTVGKIVTGNTAEVNDFFLGIFYAAGQIVPVYLCLLMPGAGRQTRLRPLPFCIAGMFSGFFALAPYIAGRVYAPDVSAGEVRALGPLARICESRAFGVTLLLYAAASYFVALGLSAPAEMRDVIFYACWQDTVRLFAEDRVVNTTILDMCLLSTIMWGPLCEDMRRRGWVFDVEHIGSYAYALSILAAPFLGPALYLVLRPRLPERAIYEPTQSSTE